MSASCFSCACCDTFSSCRNNCSDTAWALCFCNCSSCSFSSRCFFSSAICWVLTIISLSILEICNSATCISCCFSASCSNNFSVTAWALCLSVCSPCSFISRCRLSSEILCSASFSSTFTPKSLASASCSRSCASLEAVRATLRSC